MKLDIFNNNIMSKPTTLYYKLNIVFGLFFLCPVGGFVFFGYRYGILTDAYVPVFLLGVFCFALIGFVMLRKLFDQIVSIADTFSGNLSHLDDRDALKTSANELQSIVSSFTTIENQFRQASVMLEKRASEVSILKELSDLCYVTFDTEEILYITLERALILTQSDLGSVLILDKNEPKSFVIKASIGLGELIQIGDRFGFDDGVAKYAVVNKSPIIVKDIEQDRRFGRSNRNHYGTKSFVCMPIKTSNDIIGVLTISSKDKDRIYQSEDVEALAPLLSNAAFTYENLRLMRSNDRLKHQIKAIGRLFKLVNSSFREGELIHALLNELQNFVPFKVAYLISKQKNDDNYLTIEDCFSSDALQISKGNQIDCTHSILRTILHQETEMMVTDAGQFKSDPDQRLFDASKAGAWFITPLKIDGHIVGAFIMGCTDAALLQRSRKLIEWVANTLALSQDRNRLSIAVAHQGQQLNTIKQIGAALASSTFNLNQVLKHTMDMIRELMNVEGGSLLLLEDGQLRFAVAFNLKLETLPDVRLKLGQGIAGKVAARGEPIIDNHMQNSPYFLADIDRKTGFTTTATLCVPIISQGKILGVIEVLNKLDGKFNRQDEDLLQSIASSVSVAIENSRLYEETVAMAEHERGIRRIFQKFVPKQVLDTIIHGSETGRPLVEELKTLTLLNIDIRDFSKISRQIGPQKTVALLNTYFSIMGGIVFKHHGIVDKYLGDGFLAIFGAPVSTTQDADNAVMAALDMRNHIEPMNQQIDDLCGITIDIGITIHTGEMVVGNFGFDMKMDYTVIGDSVNDVFRLQEIARSHHNAILISANVCRAAMKKLDIQPIELPSGIRSAWQDREIFELSGQREELIRVLPAIQSQQAEAQHAED